jgi:tetratricopeptide (TPR) repeat protein
MRRLGGLDILLKSFHILLILILMIAVPAFGQQDAAYWFYKGMELYDQNNFADSIEAYDKALDIDPNDAEAWNNKGVALGLLGRFDEALQAFGQATTLNNSYAEAWYNMGMVLDFQKKYPAAIQAYKRATQINPSYQKALENKNYDINRFMAPVLSCCGPGQLPYV